METTNGGENLANTNSMSERGKQSKEVMQKMLADLNPLIEEYDRENVREKANKKPEFLHGVLVEVSESPRKPNQYETIMDLPESVKETTKKMVEQINEKRKQLGLPKLVAHGSSAGRIIGMIETGMMNPSHFGTFEIGEYNPDEGTGFFDDQPVWVIKPENIPEGGVIPANQLVFLVPHPKAEAKLLNRLIQKIDEGKIDQVGTTVSSLRGFAQYMNNNRFRLPVEISPK